MEERLVSIRGVVILVLGTTHIIETSKAIDTIIGRIELLQNTIKTLIELSNLPNYMYEVQLGIDDFKNIHYNIIPTDKQLSIIIKPKEFSFDEYFVQELYVAVVERFVPNQQNEFNNLKLKSARINRMANIIEKTQMAIEKTISINSSNLAFNEFVLKNYNSLILQCNHYIELLNK